MRAKQLVTCPYLYHMTSGTRQKASSRIAITVKHIIKCLCFRSKNEEGGKVGVLRTAHGHQKVEITYHGDENSMFTFQGNLRKTFTVHGF